MAAGWHVLREGSEPVPGYRLLEYLGGGSLGEVWRASGPGGTQVALKIVNLRRRGTLHEFRALEQVKNIRDPHLVPVVAYWLLDESGQVIADPASALWASGGSAPASAAALPSGRPRAVTLIIAMGLGSKSLFERLEECVAEGHSGIPWKELLEYMEDAARGIDFLNRPSQQHESIIHGDIKPHNILIVGNAAQVCDFGLARAVDSIRATNMPVGTVAYAAPELLQSRPLHRNTDQYCLAVSYVELRTGALPFDAETVVGICEKHVKGQLDLSGLKPCERTVIARAVALDPDQRWPSCRDMVRALRLACEADESAGRLGPERLGSEIVPGCWLQEHLGQGSLGSCWKARSQDGSWLALKVLELNPAEAVAQVHALRAIRAMRHERLLPILRLWVATEEGFVYEDRGEAAELAFLEPYATGVARPVKVVLGWELGARNLRAAFPGLGEASASLAAWRDVLHCLDDVAEGLDFIHSTSTGLAGTRRGPLAPGEGAAGPVVHGRLKPENVILVGHAAKIGDFGVHRALGLPVVPPTEATAPGIAPEARTGKLVPASDQFALAICYVEIRTGRPAQPPAEKRDTLPPPSTPPVDLSGLPGDEERAVVARALAPRPEDRWPSCEAFVQHLRAACEADERRLQRPRRGAEAPGSEILPGYRLVEKLGQGQIGRVWKAVGRGGMLRALKIVDLRGRAGLKELRALEQVKGIRSGNLISVSSYWLVDREGFLLTDVPEEVASLVAGGKGPAARETTGFPAAELIIEMDLANKTLLQRLRECQRAGLPAIPVDELLRYMEQAAAGIDYLNQPEQRPDTPPIEIVHGDIKPQNIMIMGNTAAVGDFGLARIVQRLGIQQTGMGTPAYAAPELLRGLPHRTSDQYCLAMTYVELRTGRLPFDEPDAMAIARRHLEGRLDLDRTGLPPAELAVIRKATAMDPGDRYASCSEMVRALRRAVEGVFTLRARGPAPEEQFAGGQTLTALSSPGVQTGGATLVPPKEALAEAVRRTPEGPGAAETQPAEPLGLPPLGQPAELEPTIVAWPTRSRPSRRWIAVAGGLVALLALATALAYPPVRQWATAWFPGPTPPPVSDGEPEPPEVPTPPGQPASTPEDVAPSPSPKPTIPPPEPPSRKPPKVPTMLAPGAELLARIKELIKAGRHQETAKQLETNRDQLSGAELEELRSYWRDILLEQWKQDPTGPDLAEACSAMISRFPKDSAEARILRVRALVQRRQYADAARYLQEEKADPEAAWPPEAKPLREALEQLVAALNQPESSLAKLQEALRRLDAIDWGPADPRWRLDAAEKALADELRRQVASMEVVQLRRELAELLKRSRDMLEKGRFAEARPLVLAARNTVDKLGRMPGQSRVDVQRQLRDSLLECDLLAVVMALGDPTAQPATQAEALAAAEKLLAEHAARLTPEQLRLLVSGAGALRGTKDAAVLARAMAFVRGVCQRAPGRPELAARLAGLWQARIAQQIGQREPTPADFEEFQKDWALWERVPEEFKRPAAADLHLVELWRLENLLLAGKSAEVRPPDLAGLPKEFEPYGHYLAARIHLASGRVDEALQSLDRLFGQKPTAPAVGQVPERLQHAIGCVVTAVQEARRLRPGKNRFEPYADGQEAKRHLHLLQDAQAAIASHRAARPEPKETPALLDSPLEVQFQLALALAALAAGDLPAAASATDALARLRVSELSHPRSDDRLLAPYAYVVSHIPATPQDPLPAELREPILQNAAHLLALLTDWHPEPLARDEADKLYRTVIAPLLARSDQKWTASDERFLSSASEFLWARLEDDWPAGRAKILEHLENALSAAIGLTGATAPRDRPRYLMRRAQVRLAWQPPRLGEATADADAALELDGRNPKVRGVHAEAHLLMSRTQDLRKARIDHLKKAMESAELAVRALRATEGEQPTAETPPKEPAPSSALAGQRELPGYMLTLSMARLEYANFASDNRQQYLDEAAKLAHDAARLIGQNDPRAATTYMALGNACEDLAWAAEQEPEKFYPEAIQAFNRANRLRQLPSAEALRSIGRCYYRAAVESVLDRLGGLNRTGMLQQAAQHLEQVTRQLDPQDAEAWYYLGLVYWNQDPANYAKAAGCFETARKVAIAQNRPDYAYYLFQWAVFPWNDPNLRGQPQWLATLRAAIAPRLDELEKAPVPAGAAIHPQREALHQRARFAAAEEKWDEAIRLCEQALQQVPQPDWAEVYLLLDLAQYRLKQAGKLLEERNTDVALQRADQALEETQKAQAAAISLVQLANCQTILGQVYTTRWLAGWDASDWDRAVAAYAEVFNKLQPRRRIAQDAAGKIATLHLFRAMRDQPPTYDTLKLLDNGIRWQQSAYESLRIHTGETPDQFTALRNSVKSNLKERFIQPALAKAREVLNSEADPERRKQIEAWMAEWQKLAR